METKESLKQNEAITLIALIIIIIILLIIVRCFNKPSFGQWWNIEQNKTNNEAI